MHINVVRCYISQATNMLASSSPDVLPHFLCGRSRGQGLSAVWDEAKNHVAFKMAEQHCTCAKGLAQRIRVQLI